MKSNLKRFKEEWKKERKTNIEIYDFSKLLNLKSKSVVKRVLIISIVEFCLPLITAVILNKKNISNNSILLIFLNYLYYSIFIYYFIRFWINWRKMDLNLNLKKLLEFILQLREHVYKYISLNIVLFNFNIIILYFQYLESNNTPIIFGKYIGTYVLFSKITLYILIVVISTIISFTIWLIYKILYLRIVEKLYQNLKELNR